MKPASFFAIIALVAVAAVAPNAVVAQTTGAGPYYATPSWDQQLQCDTQATCPRFIVLSNWRDANFPSGGAAVLDRETGLVWERSPSTDKVNWQVGHNVCAHKSVGNRIGWRLPMIHELASLIDPTVPVPGPALPAGHPFNILTSIGSHWSENTVAADSAFAWVVNLVFGSTGAAFKVDDSNFVWCVRGGQGVPQ